MDRKLFLVVILALFSVSAAGAQEVNSFAFNGVHGIKIGGLMTSVTELLKRADVQVAITLTLKQKAELNDLMTQPRGLRVAIESNSPLSEEERNKRIREQIEAQLAGPDQKLKEVLRPEQYARLKELQLQWAGPLIMADSKVASNVKIQPEHRTEISKISEAYQRVKQEVMEALSQKESDESADGSQRRVMVRLNTKELENPVSPYTIKLSAAKRDAEDKIMGLLSPAEKNAWIAAQGAPFKFRKDLPGLRF